MHSAIPGGLSREFHFVVKSISSIITFVKAKAPELLHEMKDFWFRW